MFKIFKKKKAIEGEENKSHKKNDFSKEIELMKLKMNSNSKVKKGIYILLILFIVFIVYSFISNLTSSNLI